MDSSINWIEQALTGFIETRYVRRTGDYFIAYLSSQTGCNRGCKMCHLTATRQMQFRNCDQMDYLHQLDTVMSHYDRERHLNPARLIHVNLMARGEALANPTVTETSVSLLASLAEMCTERDLLPKFNISTIMPTTFRKPLSKAFPLITPTIYYSIYSVNPDFRNTWLPAAMPVSQALDNLADYQAVSKKIIKFHGAFIQGENDDLNNDVRPMMELIRSFGIRGEFNIVRYNPYNAEQGEESNQLLEIQELISAYMPCKIIPRVGTDCKASCGQFVTGED